MIIEHVPDENGNPKITDTAKLNDVPAALLEAAENLRLECLKYKRQFYLAINTTDNELGQSHTFWSFLSENLTPQNEISLKQASEKRQLDPKELQAFFRMIANGVRSISGGRYQVVDLMI